MFVLRMFSSLTVIVLLLNCGGGKEKPSTAFNMQENEPNNSRAKAQSVENGTVLQGYVNKKLDQDWYRITIPNDSFAVMQATLSPIDDMDILMKLHDDHGTLLAEFDRNKQGEGERITNYGLVPGDYYLLVREAWYRDRAKTANDSIPYYLSVHLARPQVGWELEPNARGVDATPLLPDSVVRGYLSPAGDVDWYRLPILGRSSDYLEVTLSGLEGVNTKLQIYDPIEAPIHGANRGGAGMSEKITNMGIDTEKEYYFIVVSGGPGESNEDSSYQLQVKFLPQQGRMEFEPNNRLVKSMGIADGDTIYGFIDESTDVDWYEIERSGYRKEIARIEVQGVPDVDFKMTLTDELETPILVVNERGEQENEIATNVGLVEDQRYFLKIESVNHGANINDRYAVSVNLHPASATEEFEFNNAPEAANELALERAIGGYIQPVGDVDFYRFRIPNRYLGKLEIILEGIIKVNTDMILYDDTMRQLAKAASRPSEGIERITFDAFPGLYYLKVYDNDGRESNYRDPYKLAIFIKQE